MGIIDDVEAMCDKYGFDSGAVRRPVIEFRMDLLQEEVQETLSAVYESDAEEVVDGLIDVVVVALVTLQMSGVSVQDAWDQVFLANMSKVVGEKPGRKSPIGVDLVKPDGWEAPVHTHNHGVLDDVL